MKTEDRDKAIGLLLNSDTGFNGALMNLIDELIADHDIVWRSQPLADNGTRLIESQIKMLELQSFKDKLTELKEQNHV